ncbi:MAG: nucleotidyltransferase domain-containing protein [archaeon]
MNTKLLNQKFRERIINDKKVLAVLIFGSYARKEDYKDVDVCIVLDKKYLNKEMTSKRIDYHSDVSSKFDIQIFQQLPVYIRIKILKEGRIIFCKNEDRLYDIAFETIKEYNNFKEIYIGYIKNALK